ncbi:MAG: hypothetical protein ACTSPG_10145 [Candidatus Hodarchaeales archaeon]
MSWKTRKRGTPRQRGRKFKTKNTLFFPPKHQRLADIVKIDTPKNAEKSAKTLLRKFKDARTRDQKRKIKQATVCAANRALAMTRKRQLSDKERHELIRISGIYENAYSKMMLPPKNKGKQKVYVISWGLNGTEHKVKRKSFDDAFNVAHLHRDHKRVLIDGHLIFKNHKQVASEKVLEKLEKSPDTKPRGKRISEAKAREASRERLYPHEFVK